MNSYNHRVEKKKKISNKLEIPRIQQTGKVYLYQ